MGKQRIALLGGHGGRSGVPRHLHQLCSALHDTADLTLFTDENEGGYDFAADLGVDRVTVHGLSSSLNPAHLRRAWSGLSAALDAHAPFDVIWAHARLTLPLARRYVSLRRPPTRLITTYHGSPFAGRSHAQRSVVRALERFSLVRTPPHDLVFVSASDLATFDGLPVQRHRTRVIANCSDLGVLPHVPAPVHPTLVMTTRAARQKNLTAAARIFAALPDHYRLILRGPDVDTIVRHQFLRALGAKTCDRITFGPAIKDVRADLCGADAYLLTSHYEGHSIGALEAFETGLPVAMPDVGGARAMFAHHPQAVLIDPNAPQTAAADLCRLTREFRANRAFHRARTRAAWAQAFHPSIWADQMRDFIGPQSVAQAGMLRAAAATFRPHRERGYTPT